MTKQNPPKEIKYTAWYLVILFGFLLIWEIFGRAWNMFLFESTNILMGADAPLGVLIIYTFALFAAIATLKGLKVGYFGVLLIHVIIIIGTLGVWSKIIEESSWKQSWYYIFWLPIIIAASSLSIVMLFKISTRKYFFRMR